jgi:hypothetical protein
MSQRGLGETKRLTVPLAGPSLFQEDWWLDASSGGRFDRIEISWDGLNVASLPYMRKQRLGYRSLVMPPYTRTLGPLLSLPPAKPARHAANLRRVVAELQAKLPQCHQFFQRLDPDDETPMAFALAGFQLLHDFTFRIEPDQHLAEVFNNIDGRTRRLIRASAERLRIDAHNDLGRFEALSHKDKIGEENAHDFACITRLFDSCTKRNRAIILTAVNEAENDEACVILVWSGTTLYYWLPARDRALSNGGSNAYLLWEAIKFAHERGLTFDFDGFGSATSAKFLLQFGVRPLPRIGVLQASTIGHLHRLAYAVMRPRRPY